MKTVNLLSKAEMKNVMGGVEAGPINCSGSWWEAGLDNCYICCLRYEATQPAPLDPNYSSYSHCMDWCSI